MDVVEAGLNRKARRLLRRLVGVAIEARSQLLKSMRRLVTTATARIGRPEARAKAMMPGPTIRARFGTAAVSTMVSPAASLRTIARKALAPPFSRIFLPSAPEPRIAPMPSSRSATALKPPSPWRETSEQAGIQSGRAKGIMMCWPCHIAKISGRSGRTWS